MAKCPECERLSHTTRWGPSRLNVLVAASALGAILFVLLSWGWDAVSPRSIVVRLPLLPRLGHYLVNGAFWGVLWYWLMRAGVHARHTGEPFNWAKFLWPRAVIAMVLLFVCYGLLDLLR